MYTEFIDRNILNPYMDLLRDTRQRWLVLMEISINFLFYDNRLNDQRRLCKLEQETLNFQWIVVMKKAKKDLKRKIIFFMTYRSWSRKGTWKKKLRIAFINGFCFIFPKKRTVQEKRNDTKMLLYILSSQLMVSATNFCFRFISVFKRFWDGGGVLGSIILWKNFVLNTNILRKTQILKWR